MKPRALDLFCKAGGASKGLADAGFDVTGVDIEPQPRYVHGQGKFIQADALDINWMRCGELAQAVPPAYAEWIARQYLQLWRKAA